MAPRVWSLHLRATFLLAFTTATGVLLTVASVGALETVNNNMDMHARAMPTVFADVAMVDMRPVRVHATRGAQNGTAGRRAAPQPQIVYHGGRVLTGTPTLYYIWYGNWTGRSRGVPRACACLWAVAAGGR